MDGKNVYDVVIFPTPHELVNTRISIRNKVDISSDVWIGRLEQDIVKAVFESCEAPGYNYDAVRPFGQLYSFVRENPPDKDRSQWDADQRLQFCIALSRMVHPTSISFEYSARIIQSEEGTLDQIIPGHVSGLSSQAFTFSPEHNCLTEKDAETLKELLSSFIRNPLKDPLAMAMWYHEYASRINEIDLRWALIATGLEVLIHTDRPRSTKQFVTRIPQLANMVGTITVTSDEAEEMYACRSSLAHGQGMGAKSAKKEGLYNKMERLLGLTLQKAILDPSFAGFLSDRNSVRSAWPI